MNTLNFNETIYHYNGLTGSPITHARIGITHPDASYEIVHQNSEIYSIEYVYEGEGVIQHNNSIYKIEPGDLFILHKNSYHHYYSNPKKPWKKIWITIDDGTRFIDYLIKDYHLTDVIHVPHFNNPGLFEECFESIRQNSYNATNRLELFTHRILATVSRFINDDKNNQISAAEKIKLYMDKNVNKRITTQMLTWQVRLEESQIRNIFKSTYGISPMAYLKQQKVKEAQKLLDNPDISIKDVAKAFAFYDVHHFSSTFKKITGITPTEYRKNKTVTF